MEIEQIIDEAKKIIGNYSIEILKDEKELLDKISDIEVNTTEENKNYNKKILSNIKSYLEIKKKIKIRKEDYEFLQNIAQNLRNQEVRRTDISNPPLFEIKNKDGNDLFFITRSALNEYIECNRRNEKDNKTIIEIPSNHSYELEMLIEIIKRNF